MEFYLTSPDVYVNENSLELPPFVVVDLVTRKCRIEEKPFKGNPLPGTSPKGWKVEPLKVTGDDPRTSLPKSLTYHVDEDAWVKYELETSTRRYKISSKRNIPDQ